MSALGILHIAVYFVLILAITKPMGAYMAKVFQGQRTFLHPLLRPVERLIYRLIGVREDTEQRWTQYAASRDRFQRGEFSVCLSHPAPARLPALQPHALWH